MGEFHPKYRQLKISIGDLVGISVKKNLGTKHEVIFLNVSYVSGKKNWLTLSISSRLKFVVNVNAIN